MSRRDRSKREKLRLEEGEIDKQLQDAGFEVAGMSMEEKKEIYSMLEESRKSAQEEEDRRQKEDEIFIETLNKSFSEKSDVKENKTTDSAIKSNRNALPLTVKAAEPIAEQNSENNKDPDSGSTTPDLFPSPTVTPAKAGTNLEQIHTVKGDSPEPLIEEHPSPVSEIASQGNSVGPGDNEVECPICQKYFPASKIEAHASDCIGPSDDFQSEQSDNISVGMKRRHNNMKNAEIQVINENSSDYVKFEARNSRRGRARTPPDHARCGFCHKVCKEGDEYLIHVEDCESNFKSSSMVSINSRTPGKNQESYSLKDASSSAIKSRPPIGKRASAFEHLEGDNAVQVHHGDITDAAYRNPTTAIVHIVNCVAVRPHGLSETLALKYPYCNIYRGRQPIDRLNRSCVADRGKPGRIKICRPDINGQDPVVVGLYGQFYMGKVCNKNVASKNLVAQMKRYMENSGISQANAGFGEGMQDMCSETNEKYFDPDLLRGLESDTSENRIKWFKEALEHLAHSVVREDIKMVVFPFGIGCGLGGGNWEKDYYPAIVTFSKVLAKQGVNVVLVKMVEKTVSEHAQAAAGTQKTSRYKGTKNKK